MCDKVFIIVITAAGILISVSGTFYLLKGIWQKGYLLKDRGRINKFFERELNRLGKSSAPEVGEYSWYQVDEIWGAFLLVLGFISQLFSSILSTYCA